MSVVADYRDRLLEIATGAISRGPGYAQEAYVLTEAARLLGAKGDLGAEQKLLDAWQDLFRTGELSWGYDLNNPQAPFFHKAG